MKHSPATNSRLAKGRRLFFISMLFSGVFLAAPTLVQAHQTPNTIVLLDVSPGRVAMELQLPLTELELAFGQPLSTLPDTSVERLNPQIKEYLLAHIHAFVTRENPWLVNIAGMELTKGEQAASGPPYRELVVHLVVQPPVGVSTRKFLLDYDVIMHQVINHTAFVAIRNDWETGKAGGDPATAGVIQWNLQDNVIYPLEINLQPGNWSKGFKGMVSMGMAHIAEGTDHLLFLLALLLPAPLLVGSKRWAAYGGVRYSAVRLLKVVTAFTIGHSITLLLGSLGWVRIPGQPVEILIAFSILLSAIHALRPLFPGKEMYVAAGFGLIHGMAFAAALARLDLTAGPMALSIFGFNAGIELMQLLVIACTMPWLIILSRTRVYTYVRTTGAAFAGVAAAAWIWQRSTGKTNQVTALVDLAAAHATWLVAALAVLALSSFLWHKTPRKHIYVGLRKV